ncbi:MAG: hypothetical protein AABM64_07920 [Pseudomonadota bacterium]
MHAGIVVTLPGGALIGERLAHEAAFRPFTGRLEEQLAELDEAQAGSRPTRVSALLAAALAHVGGREATRELVAGLGFTDRQFLMLAFALQHGDDQQWRHVTCARCAERFDVGFRLSGLPVTPAGDGYPWTQISVAGRQLRLRVPTGEDEERIARMAPEPARRALALGCIVSIDEAAPQTEVLEALCAAEVDAIDAALDALAPQLPASLATACSECGTAQTLELDPYDIALPQTGELYREVHALALRYHWSEDEILQLSRERRRLYLDLIDEHPHEAS